MTLHGSRGRMAWFIGLVAVITSVSGLTTPAHSAPQGRLKMTLVAPKGVAATVVLKRGPKRITVAKKTSGRTRLVTKRAATGTWRVTARPVQSKGRFYVPTVKPDKARVRNANTTRVRVVYKRADTAWNLRVADLSTSKVTLAFDKPKAKTPVRVRFAVGTKAPQSVGSGRAVKIGAKSKRASVTRLKANTTYSFSLFTKAGKRWVGPLTLTAATDSSEKSSAAFVAGATTVLVKPADKVPAKIIRGRVTATLPSSATVVVGSPVVLPRSAALPGGFVGRITSVGNDGRTVTLVQTPLTDAFDYLDVEVPRLEKAGTQSSQSASVPSAFEAQAGPKQCAWNGSRGITVPNPRFAVSDGYFKLKVNTKGWGFVRAPVGVSIDTKVAVTGTMSIDAKVSGDLQCSIGLPTLTRTFMAGPVPMALQVDVSAMMEVKGSSDFTSGGLTATLGFQGKTYMPLKKGKGSGSGEVIHESKWLSPHGNDVGTFDAKFGGTLSFGPGIASDAAGVTAGLAGTFDPLTLQVNVSRSTTKATCFAATAGGKLSADVHAKAWIRSLKAEAKYQFVNKSWLYGDPFSYPDGCADDKPNPVTPSTKWTWTDPPNDPVGNKEAFLDMRKLVVESGQGKQWPKVTISVDPKSRVMYGDYDVLVNLDADDQPEARFALFESFGEHFAYGVNAWPERGVAWGGAALDPTCANWEKPGGSVAVLSFNPSCIPGASSTFAVNAESRNGGANPADGSGDLAPAWRKWSPRVLMKAN